MHFYKLLRKKDANMLTRFEIVRIHWTNAISVIDKYEAVTTINSHVLIFINELFYIVIEQCRCYVIICIIYFVSITRKYSTQRRQLRRVQCLKWVDVTGIPQCRFTDIRQTSYMKCALMIWCVSTIKKNRDDRNIDDSSF